ncbi:unnamed protein product [Calicophoron daubneyi]|uniref:SRCR domain-containing protein n=1 Tax=Calicophoron daubneyi TaxID=300641 RepID=A0AAV2T3L1_CALDB
MRILLPPLLLLLITRGLGVPPPDDGWLNDPDFGIYINKQPPITTKTPRLKTTKIKSNRSRPVYGYSANLMLIDGAAKSEGTVLINRNGRWGTVCDDHWTLAEANVVCHALGYPHALQATTRDYFFSSGYYDYLMDDVRCRGTEKSLEECSFWPTHDCLAREEAGVVCINPEPITFAYNVRRPRLPGLDEDEVRMMLSQRFTTSTKPMESSSFILVLVHLLGGSGEMIGGVCVDRFHGAEANVVCRSAHLGYAKAYSTVSVKELNIPDLRPLVQVGHCYGNESRLEDCVTFASPEEVPCSNKTVIVMVNCSSVLADLQPDVRMLQESAYGTEITLFSAQCAIEENCFPPSVYHLFSRNAQLALMHKRRLMRFSSIIHNEGTADFIPHEKPENWVWHACHMHYHSMKVFTYYKVVDSKRRVLAVGLKASFCLEDNECKPGYKKRYVCSTLLSKRGTQGISPGCQDNYFHDYDCQWIDVTDVLPGQYTFQLVVNPEFLVPEITYANNAIVCTITIRDDYSTLTLKDCRLSHPFDLD